MQSPGAKTLAGIAALALVVVLFVVLSGSDDEPATPGASTTSTTETLPVEPDGGTGAADGDDQGPQDKPDKPPKPEVATIVVKGGVPVGGVQELTFTEGDDIRFKVESDVADEVHFHGYDVSMDVEAGGSVSFDVPATLTGEFEVELEHSVTQLAAVTVNPS